VDRFSNNPDKCREGGGHYWWTDGVVIDTNPQVHSEYCLECPAYHEMLVADGIPRVWSEAKVHERFRRTS